MFKRFSVFFVLLFFVVLLAGCETMKGMVTGASDGMRLDWEKLVETDAWMRENLW